MADSLKVECPHCSGTLKLKDRSADGKKVRCPKCQEVFKVELPEEDDFGDGELDDFGDDFGDEAEIPEEVARKKGGSSSKKPVKKKRKSGGGSKLPLLIVAIAAVVLLAVGGIVFVVSQSSGGGGNNKIDLTYLPADANMVMVLKVDELFNSPLLNAAVNQPAAQQLMAQQTQAVGVSGKEMTSVTVGSVVDESTSTLKMPQVGPMGMGRPATQSRNVTVIRCSVPLKAEEIGTTKLGGVAQTHAGKTYYKKANGEASAITGGNSVYFPEPTIAVMAMEDDIKKVIDQGSKQVRRKEYDFVNPGVTLLVAFAPKSVPNPSATLESPASQPNLQALERTANKTFRAGSFGIKVTDKIDLEALVKCADAAGATEMKTATEAIFADLKSQFDRSKTMLTLMDLNDVVALADKSLASLNVQQSNAMVTAGGTIPNDITAVGENLAKKFPGIMGEMPKGGAPMAPPGSSGGLPTAGFPDPSQLPGGVIPPGALPPGVDPAQVLPAGALPPGTTPPMPPK